MVNKVRSSSISCLRVADIRKYIHCLLSLVRLVSSPLCFLSEPGQNLVPLSQLYRAVTPLDNHSGVKIGEAEARSFGGDLLCWSSTAFAASSKSGLLTPLYLSVGRKKVISIAN